MAGERRLNYGADATDAKWRSEHDTTDNRFIVAEDLDGGTILLEYDETAAEWVSRGPVNMSGNDVTNVGALDAASVSTDNADIKDRLNLGDEYTQSTTVTVADDDFADTNIDGDTTSFIFIFGDGTTRDAIVHIRFNNISFVFQGSDVNGTTGQTPTGTTGSDASLNLFVDGVDLYVENRTGDEREVTLWDFSQ